MKGRRTPAMGIPFQLKDGLVEGAALFMRPGMKPRSATQPEFISPQVPRFQAPLEDANTVCL